MSFNSFDPKLVLLWAIPFYVLDCNNDIVPVSRFEILGLDQ